MNTRENISHKRRLEAAEWVTMNEIGLSHEQQRSFDEWIRKDAANKDTYLQLNQSWNHMDRLLGLQTVYKSKANPDLLTYNYDKVDSRPRCFSWNSSVGIAAVLLIFLSLGLLLTNNDVIEFVGDGPVEISVPRIERMNLDDGSVVTLNHHAAIKPMYNDGSRLIEMISGEANFEVAKDPDRPFIVNVSGVELRALGTAFNVKYTENGVEVIVTEGVVSLNAYQYGLNSSDTSETIVNANERVTVSFEDQDDLIVHQSIDNGQMVEALIWQPKLIDFDNVTLSQIIEEFNRRNPIQLQLNDPQLQSLRLTSYFWSDNVNGFIRLLEMKYDISAVQTDKGSIYLYKAE